MSDLRFELGQVMSTPGALRALDECNESAWRLLARHARCDFGELCEADRRANELAVEQGGRGVGMAPSLTGRGRGMGFSSRSSEPASRPTA